MLAISSKINSLANAKYAKKSLDFIKLVSIRL